MSKSLSIFFTIKVASLQHGELYPVRLFLDHKVASMQQEGVMQMTLQELEQLETEVLTPKQVAPILGCTPYSINVAVKKGRKLSFPVIVINSWVRIPKQPFIKFMKGELRKEN